MSHTDLQCSARGQSAFGWDFCHCQGDPKDLPFLRAQLSSHKEGSMPGAPQKHCNFFAKTATVKSSVWESSFAFPGIPRGSEDEPVLCPLCAVSVLSPPCLCHCRGLRSDTDLAQVPLARPLLQPSSAWIHRSGEGRAAGKDCTDYFVFFAPHTAVLCLSSPSRPNTPIPGAQLSLFWWLQLLRVSGELGLGDPLLPDVLI